MKPCDVIKAVEVLATDRNCIECPFSTFNARRSYRCFYCIGVPKEFWQGILDIFKSKDAKIDILIRKKESLMDEIEELQLKNSELEIELKEMRLWDGLQKAEIERWRKDRYWLKKDGELTLLPRTDIGKIRAEAIKEFAEEVEKRCVAGGIYPAFVRATVKRVKEEMVGEKMYESPIEVVVDNTTTEFAKRIDECICRIVQRYAVNVDEEELIKALKYDRGQYEKGYSDGIKEFAERLKVKYKRHFSNEWRAVYDTIDNLVKEMTEGNENA